MCGWWTILAYQAKRRWWNAATSIDMSVSFHPPSLGSPSHSRQSHRAYFVEQSAESSESCLPLSAVVERILSHSSFIHSCTRGTRGRNRRVTRTNFTYYSLSSFCFARKLHTHIITCHGPEHCSQPKGWKHSLATCFVKNIRTLKLRQPIALLKALHLGSHIVPGCGGEGVHPEFGTC